ncbi:MAG: hypothetical protein LUE24_14835 [Lachnospiraceae bacterium]|nr:hypothetical protein [Lachnospiraceae bacterium]
MKKPSIDFTELKKRRREIIVPLALMAGLLVAIFIVVQFLGRAERVTIDETLYQYIFETADVYSDGVTMKKDEDSVLIDYGHQTVTSSGYPLYFQGQDKLILTESFLYLQRDGNTGGKVSYFTEITALGNETFQLDDGANTTLKGGMLHNGGDVFIFLEPATVEYNGKTKEIAEFSYVVCFQGQSILIWSYGDEEAVLEDLDGSGASVMMENGIEVDVANDVYYRANGTKYLLFTDPDIFDPVSTAQEE